MAATGGHDDLTRDHHQPQRASYVELFLDVVYVFALGRVTAVLADDIGWRSAYESLLLFLAVWWIWYRIARTTNRYDPGRPVIQLMVILTMLGSLLIATAVAKAFGEWGLIFASIYVVTQVGRYLWLVLIGGDPAERRLSGCILFWTCLSAVPWIVGGFTHDGVRLALWTLAVFLDYLGDMLDFPTPLLGRAGQHRRKLAEGHLSERYRQFVIIALGETSLVIGREFRPYGFQEFHTIAVLVTFATTVLMWQIYFYRAGAMLTEAIASARAPQRVGELAWYAHLTMALGIGLTAVDDRLVVDHPVERTAPGLVLVAFGGPALFLIGRGILDYAAFSHMSWSRPAGIAALAALAPVALMVPEVATSALAALVLAGVAASNIVAWRLYPRTPTPPRWSTR
jgi:low temperature requirement protein LtrA